MAICPGCQGEMATMAIVCPHCGHNTAKLSPEEQVTAVFIREFRRRTSRANPLIATGLLLLVAGAVIGDYLGAGWLTMPMWTVGGILLFVGIRRHRCPNCDGIVEVSARAPHCPRCGVQLHR